MNFKSLIFMSHWCIAKSTAQSTQRAVSVFVIFTPVQCHWVKGLDYEEKFISGCVRGVFLCEVPTAFLMERSAFLPTGNSHTCPGGGESRGPNKLPRADGVPF